MTPDTEVLQRELVDRIDAYAATCAQHGDGARRVARALLEQGGTTPAAVEVDALIGRASADLWPSVAAGDVRAEVVQPHLLAAVRRAADPSDPPVSPVVTAFAALPAAAQLELWRTEVEDRPAEAPELLEPARAALPSALVDAHAATTRRGGCRTVRPQLASYAVAGVTPAESSRIAAHLAVCRPCSAVYRDVTESQSDLGGLLTRAFLGAAAGAYLAGLVPVGATSEVEPAASHRVARGLLTGLVAAGLVAAAAALAGSGVLGGPGEPADAPVAAPPVVATPEPVATAAPATATEPTEAADAPVRSAGASAPSDEPSQTSTQPPAQPIQQPTQQPTQQPSQPTQQPSQTPTQPPSPTGTQTTPAAPTVDPNAVDLAVRSTRTGLGVASVIGVGVSGLPAGQTATLTLTSDSLVPSLQLDPGCSLVGLGTATCTVSGDRMISVVGVSLLAPASTMTVTAVPDGALYDTSTGDNTTTIALDGRV